MATEEMNLGDIVKAGALEDAKRGPFISPWRMNANPDNLHEGLEECGCGFCPDDDREPTELVSSQVSAPRSKPIHLLRSHVG
jgi:hypothetical protein